MKQIIFSIKINEIFLSSKVFIVFAFTGIIDLIIALELKGFIGGFMSLYLSIGEPYLSSPWGYAIVLFDGTFFYAMYLILIHNISNK